MFHRLVKKGVDGVSTPPHTHTHKIRKTRRWNCSWAQRLSHYNEAFGVSSPGAPLLRKCPSPPRGCQAPGLGHLPACLLVQKYKPASTCAICLCLNSPGQTEFLQKKPGFSLHLGAACWRSPRETSLRSRETYGRKTDPPFSPAW